MKTPFNPTCIKNIKGVIFETLSSDCDAIMNGINPFVKSNKSHVNPSAFKLNLTLSPSHGRSTNDSANMKLWLIGRFSNNVIPAINEIPLQINLFDSILPSIADAIANIKGIYNNSTRKRSN